MEREGKCERMEGRWEDRDREGKEERGEEVEKGRK